MINPNVEVFTAFSVGESRDATIAVLGRAALPISVAATEQKDFVRAGISDAPHIESLIERRFSPRVVAAWEFFRQVGLTVAPALYTREVAGRQYMADVKRDGSEVYGRHISSVVLQGGTRLYPRVEIDAIFVDILKTPSTAAEVWRTIEERVALATKLGIELPIDDPYELIVSPSGKWDHISLDLEQTRFPAPSRYRDADLAESNGKGLKTYRTRLEYLAQML